MFYLDGLELIPCAPLSGIGSPSCLYSLPAEVGYAGRAETFARVSFSSSLNEWHVWSTTGVKRTYRRGHTVGGLTLDWDLASVEDTLGNKVRYSYIADSGVKGPDRYISSITYGGARIRFRWERRPDPIVFATGRGLITSRRRLVTIDVHVGDERARAYSLTYKQQVPSGAGRSRLVRVRTFGRNAQLADDGTVTGGTGFPPATFEYPQGGGVGQFALGTPFSGSWAASAASPTGHTSFNEDTFVPWYSKRRWRQWFPGDVDGDGRSDLMGAYLEEVLGTPAGGNEWRWILRSALVNRDGTGSRPYRTFEFPTGWIWHHDPGLDFARTMSGDVNGDGRSDFVVVTKNDFGLGVSVRTAISHGDGQFDLNGNSVPITGWDKRNRWFTGDVDADGRADLVLVAHQTQCNPACGCSAGSPHDHAAFIVGISRGDGTFAFAPIQQTCWSYVPWDDAGWFLGDANGDGRKDILRVTNHEPDAAATTRHAAFQVAVARGDGLFTLQPEFDTAVAWSTYQLPIPYYDQPFGSDLAQVGDINGDGRTDFVLMGVRRTGSGPVGVVLTTAFSNGDGTFRLVEEQPSPTGPNGFGAVNLNFWLTTQLGSPQFPNRWVTGDFNGDGATDLAVVAPRDRDVSQWPTTVTLRRLLSDKSGGWTIEPAEYTNWFHDCVDRDLTINAARCPEDLQSYVFGGDVNADGSDDLVYAGLQRVLGADRTSFRVNISPYTRSDAFRFLPADLDNTGASDFVYGTSDATGVAIRSLLTPRPAANYSLRTQSQPGTQDLFNPAVRDWRVMDIGGPSGLRADGLDDLVHLLYYDADPTKSGDEGLRIYSFLSSGGGSYLPVIRDAWPGFPSRDMANWRQLDVDGDGATDLVHLALVGGGLEVDTLRSQGNGTWASPAAVPAWPGFAWSDLSNWRPADVNGDGLGDLVHIAKDAAGLRVHVLFSNGDGSWTPLGRDAWPAFQPTDVRHWRTADVNGDGKTDLVRVARVAPSDVRVDALLSHGDGSWTRRSRIAWGGFSTADTEDWRLADVNDDGRVDLVHLRVGQPGITTHTLVGVGDGTWTPAAPVTHSGTFAAVDTAYWSSADVDGDGRDELARIDRVGADVRLSVLRSLASPDRIVRLKTSLGERTRVDYRPSADFVLNRPGGVCQAPAGLGFAVVDSVTREAGDPHADVEHYSYDCARWAQRDRALLGWQTMTTGKDPVANRPAATIVRRYDVSEACGARLADTQTFDDQGDPLLRKQSVFAPVGTPPFRCQTSASRSLEYGTSAVTARNVETQYSYDGFGNTQFVYDLGEPQTAGDERTTITTYHPSTGPYLVSLPASEGVYEGLGPVKLARFSSLCYDGDLSLTCSGAPTKGLLTARHDLNLHGLSDMRTTSYGYDAFGNIASVMNSRRNGTGTTYDSAYHVYPTSVCNALSQCSTTEWDEAIGQVTELRDINGGLTKYTYDALGRVKSEQTPDHTTTRFEYREWGDPARQRVVERVDDGSKDGLWAERYFDGFGRTYRTVVEGDGAGKRFEQTVEYSDASERVFRRHDWFVSGTVPQLLEEFGYDSAGRQVRQIFGDGTTRRWAYGADSAQTRVSAFDQAGRVKTTYFDAYGRVSKVVRAMAGSAYSTLAYSYDAMGEPLTVTDDRGNVVRRSWDLLGNLTSLDDPDLGVRSYSYDTVGNRLTETDARQQTITYGYDALDRLTSKTYPTGQQVTWRYDESGHGSGVGRITSMSDLTAAGCANGESERVNYDAMGHVSSQTKCVKGQAYTLAFQFGKAGRLGQITYPGGEVVTFTYDSAGRLAAMPGFVQRLRYDPAGRLTVLAYANGTTEKRSYNPRRRWLASQQVRHGRTTVFDAHYRRTPTNLLSQSSSTTNAMNSIFTYDDLGRLLSVTGDQAQVFRYDSVGNMTFNSRVGVYSYPPPGPTGCSTAGTPQPCPRPHAVGAAGAQAITYDRNGQLSLVSDAAGNPIRSIDWTFDHKPAVMSDAMGVVTSLEYDGWGNRVWRERGTDTSRWYGQFFEYSPTQGGLIKNYYAGSMLVARRDARGLQWFHMDHLGSIRAATDLTGAVAARFDYSAYGEPAGATVGPRPQLGFIGQQADTDAGLIHLAARDYDPYLGRFISPDTIVPDPTDPQAANRYSYVYNSPLNYVDPSGHDPESSTPEDSAEAKETDVDPKDTSTAYETVVHCHCKETGKTQQEPQAADPVQNDLPVTVALAEERPVKPIGPPAISDQQLQEFSRQNMFESACPSCHRFRPGTQVRLTTPAEKYAFLGISATAWGAALAAAGWQIAVAASGWTVIDTASVWLVQRVPWLVPLIYGASTGGPKEAPTLEQAEGTLEQAQHSVEELSEMARGAEERAKEIHAALDDPVAERMRTTVVVRAQTQTGEIVDVVAAGAERDLSPAQLGALGPLEVPARLPGADAEMTALSHIHYQGWSPLAFGVTRDMCPNCTFFSVESGGVQITPRQMIWPGAPWK